MLPLSVRPNSLDMYSGCAANVLLRPSIVYYVSEGDSLDPRVQNSVASATSTRSRTASRSPSPVPLDASASVPPTPSGVLNDGVSAVAATATATASPAAVIDTAPVDEDPAGASSSPLPELLETPDSLSDSLSSTVDSSYVARCITKTGVQGPASVCPRGLYAFQCTARLWSVALFLFAVTSHYSHGRKHALLSCMLWSTQRRRQ
jgi:hypothetical protein